MKEKGLTLLEVAVSTMLLSLLILGLWTFFSTAYINYLQLEEKSRIQDEARIVEEFITQEIASAKNVRILDIDGNILTKSSDANWKANKSFDEVQIDSIILNKDDATKIYVDDTNTNILKYGTSNVLTDLLKDGSIYASKEQNSDVVTIKLYLEKERSYRSKHPVTVHSFTTYIKVSLKYKDDN